MKLIVGLGNPQGDAEKDKEIIKTRLTPIPEFRLRFEQVNGKILIILDIFKGEETGWPLEACNGCQRIWS